MCEHFLSSWSFWIPDWAQTIFKFFLNILFPVMFKKCKQKTLAWVWGKTVEKDVTFTIRWYEDLYVLAYSSQFKLIWSTKITEFNHFQPFKLFWGYFFHTFKHFKTVKNLVNCCRVSCKFHVWKPDASHKNHTCLINYTS